MLKQEFILTHAMDYHWCFDIWDRFELKAVVRSKNPMSVKVNYVYRFNRMVIDGLRKMRK